MLKNLKWVAGSKKDLMAFPDEVKDEIGYALYVAQKGGTAEITKIFKGFGSGIYEIVSDHNKNAYRTIYVVNLDHDNIYVLHAFQKKSKYRIKTPKEDVWLIQDRLKRLKNIIATEVNQNA